MDVYFREEESYRNKVVSTVRRPSIAHSFVKLGHADGRL